MSNQLRPCPFCGGEAIITNDYLGKPEDDCWKACCKKNCLTTLLYEVPEDAAKKWNTRPAEDELRAENARLFEQVQHFRRMAYQNWSELQKAKNGK